MLLWDVCVCVCVYIYMRDNRVWTYVVQSQSSKRFQTMIVLFALLLAKNLESDENARHIRIDACAANARNACPDGT